jgi:hypothetical protein
LVAAALRVVRAMSCMNAAKATAHSEVSTSSRRKPSGPLAIETPNGRARTTRAAVMGTLFTASASRRPMTRALRETGAARSLSK